ncbi:ribonuclease P protein component [Ruficoccus sp. ZRK36]|uniref:ribonuclease P protein component n=1 Tax=Ruficoccus sp. ZRK36 TaxID=2866311 RepID=UPI001C739B28|nr:ribonuclease P protein component [Ruficoccus sp. ZRK36]QYY36949.1 ribonuclease P protein component [Ruficoccus sp. ZRK36]
MRFRAAQHLRTRADFDRPRRTGFRADCGAFIMRIYPTREGAPPGLRRLGVIASRKVGNAVMRNRAKRQFREIFRLNQDCLPPECDVLIIVRSQFDQLTFAQLQDKYLHAAKKYRLP